MSVFRSPFEHHDFKGGLDSALVYYLLRKYGRVDSKVFDQFPGGNVVKEVCESLGFTYFRTDFPTEIAQHLPSVSDSFMDLVLSHPPYWTAIHYTDDPKDLCNCPSYDTYLKELEKSILEAERILSPSGYFLLIAGDLRKDKELTLVHSDLYQLIESNFQNLTLRDDILWELSSSSTPFISTEWLIQATHCLIYQKIGTDINRVFE